MKFVTSKKALRQLKFFIYSGSVIKLLEINILNITAFIEIESSFIKSRIPCKATLMSQIKL